MGLPVPTTWEQLRDEAKQLQGAGLVKYGFTAQWAGTARRAPCAGARPAHRRTSDTSCGGEGGRITYWFE
ncbi:hypothetical protein ACFW1A_31035 [Kitasatospora sp. NPDC058965]|uniref:hypothetical protein n=1 Tax=Kitasatospora sp. NPDC058965 TaxID=3346682 RepID=UPI0036CF5C58